VSARHLGAALVATILGAATARAQSLTSRVVDRMQPTVSVLAGSADHRVDAQLGFEHTSGPFFGAQLDVIPLDGTRVTIRALGGALAAPRSSAAEERDLGELGATARLRLLDWLDARAGLTTRAFTGALARQRWTMGSLGAEARTTLLDGRIEGTAGAMLLPLVRVSGHSSPDLAVAGSTGLRYLTRHWDLGLGYQLERYDFPAVAGMRRLEEHSMLTLRAGYRFTGRAPRVD
jgi:hypothetical protein